MEEQKNRKSGTQQIPVCHPIPAQATAIRGMAAVLGAESYLSSQCTRPHWALWCWAQDSANHIWAWPAASIRISSTGGARRKLQGRRRRQRLAPSSSVLPCSFPSWRASPQQCSFTSSLVAPCSNRNSSLQVFQNLQNNFITHCIAGDRSPRWAAPPWSAPPRRIPSRSACDSPFDSLAPETGAASWAGSLWIAECSHLILSITS